MGINGRSFARRPDINEAVERVLFRLQAELVSGAARRSFAAPEASAMIADDRLDRR